MPRGQTTAFVERLHYIVDGHDSGLLFYIKIGTTFRFTVFIQSSVIAWFPFYTKNCITVGSG